MVILNLMAATHLKNVETRATNVVKVTGRNKKRLENFF